MPCLELPYHLEIPSLTLLAVRLDVFEAACPPAQCSESVYILYIIYTCIHNIKYVLAAQYSLTR